jgi:hypothetical protein
LRPENAQSKQASPAQTKSRVFIRSEMLAADHDDASSGLHRLPDPGSVATRLGAADFVKMVDRFLA